MLIISSARLRDNRGPCKKSQYDQDITPRVDQNRAADTVRLAHEPPHSSASAFDATMNIRILMT
jgi:hypothetical protein